MNISTQGEFAIPPGLTAELMQWIGAQSAAGVPLPSLLESMRTAGWAEHLARRALALPEQGDLPYRLQPHTPSYRRKLRLKFKRLNLRFPSPTCKPTHARFMRATVMCRY